MQQPRLRAGAVLVGERQADRAEHVPSAMAAGGVAGLRHSQTTQLGPHLLDVVAGEPERDLAVANQVSRRIGVISIEVRKVLGGLPSE